MIDSIEAAPAAAPEAVEPDAPETEAAPDEGKPPADDRETRSHRSLNRKAEKVRRELADLRSQREAFEKERGGLAEERQLAQQWRELSELSQKDRLAAARKLGLDYDTMTKEMLEEASLSDTEKATRREIAELRRERDEQKQREQEAQRSEQMREERARATAEMVKTAANPTRFPFASDLSEEALLRKADSVVEEARRAKIDLSTTTYADVVEVIDRRQAAKASYWRKKLGLTATQAAAKVVAEEAAPAKSARKTLSSRDSGDAGKTPHKTMSREERKKWAMELIPDPE